MPRLKVLILSLATLSATAFGQNASQARPGTLNYIEGQASIEGRALSPNSVGNTELQAGQHLATANGKAEILLSPGVFLRLGNDSTAQMVSPNLTQTEVRLEKGRANVEVDQLYKQNVILIDLKNGQTQLLKNGLYAFDADSSTVSVFDGKADVFTGQNLHADVKPIEVKGSRQLVLTGEAAKPQHFDKVKSEDDLYQWSSLRLRCTWANPVAGPSLRSTQESPASTRAGTGPAAPTATPGSLATASSGTHTATASTRPTISTAAASSTGATVAATTHIAAATATAVETLIVEVARSVADTHVPPQASAVAADSTEVVQVEVLTAAEAVVGNHIER